ncbi:MAG: hypothetical protein U0470_04260 [Anaerolineae bacterium]
MAHTAARRRRTDGIARGGPRWRRGVRRPAGGVANRLRVCSAPAKAALDQAVGRGEARDVRALCPPTRSTPR